MSPWLRFTLLRLLFIAVPLAVLLILFGPLYWIVWVVASVIIGFALSYIFLRGPREAMAQELAARRNAKPVAKGDDAAEDAEIAAGRDEDAED
jgi:ABC-type bacteriocin/lantibiotic exporter with double-glycine peptidase domain